MLRLRIRATSPTTESVFRKFNRLNGWLRSAVREVDPALDARVFRAGRLDGVLPPQSPAIEAEIARLLPWLPRPLVRANPSICVRCTRSERTLEIDAWRESSKDDAIRLWRIVHRYLADHPVWRDYKWVVTQDDYPLSMRRNACIPYLAHKIETPSSEPPLGPDTTEDRIEELVLEGLVAGAMGARDPLALLEIIPSKGALGFYLDRFPHRQLPAGDAPPYYYLGAEFSMDFEIRGTWRIGRGGLFGLGHIYGNSSASRRAPVSDAPVELQLP